MRSISFLLALLILWPTPARAELFQDPALQSALDEGRDDELLRLGRERGGAQGLAAQALAQADANDRAALERAEAQAQSCVQQHPQAAVCHYALGLVLGTEALQGGWMRGLRVLGRLRSALERALALQPGLWQARSSLQQIYLLLPGVAGGGLERARALELEVRQTQPELARLLRARLAAKDKDWQGAELELEAIALGNERGFQNEVLQAWVGLSRQWLKSDRHAKARERFEGLARALPELALPVFTLGRIEADAGRHRQALAHYERARSLSGAAKLAIDYRVGVAYQDLGEAEPARLHLARFLADRHAAPNNLQDARRRLKELGA